MKIPSFFPKILFWYGSLLFAFPLAGNAQPLDEVSIENQNQDIVATIHLTGPVRYLRHFPASHGKTLEVYYERSPDATSTEAWLDDEVITSPSSGFFPGFTVTTRDQLIKPKLVIEFSRETEFKVAAGRDRRSFLITIRSDKQPVSRPGKQPVSKGSLPFLPTIIPEAKPAAGAPLTPTEAAVAKINQQARALMVQGRDALQARKNEMAVGVLNKLLLLPPNDYTQDGQEWIGVARERTGQFDKAKVEYELYLRLYPKGPGAARVGQRLAELPRKRSGSLPMDSDGMEQLREEQVRATSSTAFGSVSSRYYRGQSNITSTGAPSTSSFTDTSMLITSVDASERYRTENSDSRLVFRDVNTKSFLLNQPSRNQVYAAYGEIKGRTDNYLARLGRQSSTGDGVLGRFDGLAASIGNAQELRVGGVAGELADYSQGSKPKFYGASVEKGAFSFYGINQTVDGVLDRRAVGSEVRYFDDRKNAFGLLDYDTYFKALNAVQLMGMDRLSNNATLNFMLDHRKTPSLSIRNALNGATTTSVNDLLQTMSVSSLRDLALTRTATSNTEQVGITVPVFEKWQVGGDFRVTNTTGLPASGQTIDIVSGTPTTQCTGAITAQGCLGPQPSRGLEKSTTAQVIGSGLYKPGTIWSGSLTFSTSPATNGHSIFLYNHTPINSDWMMDVSLQLFTSKDQLGGTTKQTMPVLRGSYRLSQRFTFDADCSYQKTSFSGPQSSSEISRVAYSAGLRWDF